MKPKILILVALIISLTIPAAASYIDFRNPADFAAAKDQPFFEIEHGSGFDLAFHPGPAGATLWWDSHDGFGVQYAREKDEIAAFEYLTIDFQQTVFLEKVHITDLYNSFLFLERGQYELDGSGDWMPFSAEPDQFLWFTDGLLDLPIYAYTDFITFKAYDKGFLACLLHDFSISGIEVSQVPVPGAAVLLGSGLLALLGIRRKR